MCSRALAVRCPTPAISCPKCRSGAAFRGTFEGHPPHEVIGWVTRINCFLLFDLVISTYSQHFSTFRMIPMFCCFSGWNMWNHQQCAEWFRLKKMGAGLGNAVVSTVPWVSVLDVLNGKDGLVSRLKMQGYQGWKWIWDLMRHHGKSREDVA